jgi:hypothetical protein
MTIHSSPDGEGTDRPAAPTHRELYPEQYDHPLCGRSVRVRSATDAGRPVEGTVARVVTSQRWGELAILQEYPDDRAWSVTDCIPVEDFEPTPETLWHPAPARGAWYALVRDALWEMPMFRGEDSTSPRQFDAEHLKGAFDVSRCDRAGTEEYHLRDWALIESALRDVGNLAALTLGPPR